jgi:hypothetical protein
VGGQQQAQVGDEEDAVLAVVLPAADELEEGHRGQDDGDEQQGGA